MFPALERRLEFAEGDLHYLANLCHNCGACLYACQYAPPHEFAVNLPRALAQVRVRDLRRVRVAARPSARSSSATASPSRSRLAAGLALFLVLGAWRTGAAASASSRCAGDLLRGLPARRAWRAMFGVVFAVRRAGARRSASRASGATSASAARGIVRAGASREATRDALALRYLDGGGDGCTDEDDAFSSRGAASTTSRSTASCCASRRPCVATIYHYVFGWQAPYPLLQPAGDARHARRHRPARRARRPALAAPRGAIRRSATRPQDGMDRGFIVLLLAAPASPASRCSRGATAAPWALLLALHLGVVLALFVTMPYGKFVHARLPHAPRCVRFHDREAPAGRLELGDDRDGTT